MTPEDEARWILIFSPQLFVTLRSLRLRVLPLIREDQPPHGCQTLGVKPGHSIRGCVTDWQQETSALCLFRPGEASGQHRHQQRSSEGGHAHSLLSGTFFNSGSGSPDDDVQAFLILDRFSSDPQGVTSVEAFMHWQGQFFGGVGLGSVNVGQKIVA